MLMNMEIPFSRKSSKPYQVYLQFMKLHIVHGGNGMPIE